MISENSFIVDDERIRAQELLRAFELDLRHVISASEALPQEIFEDDIFSESSKKLKLQNKEVSITQILETLTFGELVHIILQNQILFTFDSSASPLLGRGEDLSKLVALRNTLFHHRDHEVLVSDLNFMWDVVRSLIVEGFDGRRSKEQLFRTTRILQTQFDRNDLDNTLHNLPEQDYSDTGFIGRQEILRKITDLLKKEPGASGTFTWLIGPGGVGKSALALEVANRLRYSGKFELIHWASFKPGEFIDSGVRPLVDSLKNLGDISGAIAETISGSNTDQSLRDIWSALSGIPTLLILDNCESLEATQFMALSESEPPLNVRFLLTSRTHGAIGIPYRVTDFTEEECRKFIGKMGRAFGSQVLLDIVKNDDSFRNLIHATGKTPLAIKWVAKRCVKGDNLENILNSQGSLFDYCVGAGFREISPVARKLVEMLHESKDWMSTSDLISLVESSIESLQEALRELNDRMFLDQKSGDGLTTRYRLNETVENFMVHSLEIDVLKGVENRRRIRAIRLRGSQNQTAQNIKGYFSPYFVDRSSDEQNVVAARLFEALGMSKRNTPSEIRDQLKILRSIQEVAPKYWEVYRVQGHLLSWLGQNSDAEDFLMQSIELAPEGRPKARCLCFLADIVGNSDDVEALSIARRAYDASPEWFTNIKQCRFLYYAGHTEEAIDKLENIYRDSTDDYSRYVSAYEISRAFHRGTQIEIDSLATAELVKTYARAGLKNLLQCYELRFMKEEFSTNGNTMYLSFSHSIPELHLELLARFIKQITSRDEYLAEKEFIDKVTDALLAVGARNYLDTVKEKQAKFCRQAADKFLKTVGRDSISETFQSFLSTPAG